MDPNVLLRHLRESRELWEDNGVTNPVVHLDTILAQFSDLDRWLCKGGFLPTAWER